MSAFVAEAARRVALPARPPARARVGGRWLASCCFAVVALSPLPLGSNRPFFWTLWSLVICAAAAIYCVLRLRSGHGFRIGLRDMAWPAALLAGVIGMLVVQVLPLGRVFGAVPFPTAAGATVLSSTLSLAPGSTVLMLVRMVGYGLFFFLMLQAAAGTARRQWMLRCCFAAVVAYAAFGLLALTEFGDTLLGMAKWAYAGAATGPFVNRNSFATYLAFGLVLGAALLCGGESSPDGRDRRRWRAPTVEMALTGLGVLIVGTALIATQSRMGAFAAAAGSGSVVGLSLLRQKRGPVAVIGAGLGVAAVAAVALVLFGGALFERLGSLDTASDVRGALYREVLEMIGQRPWLGWGGGSFEIAFPLWHTPPVSTDLVWDKAHSTYLTLWTELGLVAGSLPMLSFFLFGRRALRLARGNGRGHMAGLAAFGIFVVGALHSLTDFSLEIEANVFLALAVLALSEAARIAEVSTTD